MPVKTIEVEKIKFKELAKAIKELNDSGKLENKIITVGKSKDDLIKSFLENVQAIPDDDEGNWTGPEAAAVYYQAITIAEEVAEKPPKAEKAKKEPKAPKEPKVKKEKPLRGKTRVESFCDSINQLKGACTIDELVIATNNDYMASGGKDNAKQTKHLISVMMPVAIRFGKVRVDGNNILPA